MKAFPRILALTALCALLLSCGVFASGGETLYTSRYCFSGEDFDLDVPNPPDGIFVTAVPDDGLARIRLGSRTIRVGDVLAVSSLESLRLQPVDPAGKEATLCYQPIHGACLGAPTRLTVRIRSGKNEAPIASDSEFETYKNIPNDGKLKGSDPENAALIFRLEQPPKRGTVSLKEDGSFTYTPNKNKVGQDSFTFTVTDEAGNTSQPAAVKIQILKPTEAKEFADMENSSDCFEAMWLTEAGLSSGRNISGLHCFCPEDAVSRGEFLLMVMKLSGVEALEEQSVSCFADCQESWMQTHLSSAMAGGLITGEGSTEGLVFRPNDPVTKQEAAVMLQNMLRLPVPAAAYDCDCNAWSCEAVTALSAAGLSVESDDAALTRTEAAKLLYEASKLR